VDRSFNVTKQEDTQKRFQFGEEKLLSATASYFYPKHAVLGINSPSEIPKRTTIALIIGYEYGNEYELIRQNVVEVRVSTQKQIIGLLNRNLVDIAIMFDEVAKYNLKMMGLQSDEIAKGQVNHVSDIYVAFSRKRGDLSQVIIDLDGQLSVDSHNPYSSQ
jgi:polar amino acid transport system substrate-binding protein